MSEIYNTNYLSSVIFRVDFPSLYSITDIPKEFSILIKENFPIAEQQLLSEFFIDIENKDKGKAFPLWIYRDKEKKKQINLSHTYFSIEFFKYHSFPEFRFIVEETYNHFKRIYEPALITRLGLRYVNKIVFKEGNPFEWNLYINSALTHPIDNFFTEKKNLSRAMTQVNLNCDDYSIIFSYGFYNSEFPNKISRKEFVLDYDCSTINIEPINVIDKLQEYNTVINGLFEKSIDAKLREEMNKTSKNE